MMLNIAEIAGFLSCLTNVAIAIVRCSGRFRYLPEANRHYAARAQDALDAILIRTRRYHTRKA